MAAITRTAGPVFAKAATPRTAGAVFDPAPAAGHLIIGGFGGNKNSGTITPPADFTIRQQQVTSDVSAAIATAAGINGGTFTWTGQAEGAVAFFETDVGAGWAFRTAAQSAVAGNTQTASADAGASPVDGVAFALCAVDSSTAATGPFSTASTVSFTNGYTLFGRYQEPAGYSGDAGGSAFVLAKKDLVAGDRTTDTTCSWTGTADQASLLIAVVDLPVAAPTGPEPGRMFLAY